MLIEIHEGREQHLHPFDTPQYINELKEIYFKCEGRTESNHKNDKGGYTKGGLTEATARSWGITRGELEEMSYDDIYVAVYNHFMVDTKFNYIKRDDIRTWVFLQHVNLPGSNIKYVQRAVYTVKPSVGPNFVDNDFGPVTLNAINSLSDHQAAKMVELLKREYLSHYERRVVRDPSQIDFIDGWKNRVAWIDTFNKEV